MDFVAPAAAVVTGGLGFALAWRIQALRHERAIQRNSRGVESLKARLDEALEAARVRSSALEQKERTSAELEAQARARLDELAAQVREGHDKLAALGGLSAEDARRELRERLVGEVREAAHAEADAIRERARADADAEARRLLSLAMDRVAVDVTRTHAAAQVTLGSSWLKSRLMSGDGANLHAFEKATGVQLVVDEGAEQVTISAFDPVRREVARRVLSELASGGSLHPARIADAVSRVGARLGEEMRENVAETLEATGTTDMSPALAGILGRLRFCESRGQDLLAHSIEVALLARELAIELGEDPAAACRAGLLHDVGWAVGGDGRADHARRGADLAAAHGESKPVCDAIVSHEDPKDAVSPLAALVAIANRVSASRPGARVAGTLEPPRRDAAAERAAGAVDGVDAVRAVLVGDALAVLATSDADGARAEVLAQELRRKVAEGSGASRVHVSVVPPQPGAKDLARA